LARDTEGLDAAVLGAGQARRTEFGLRAAEVLDPRSWLPEPGQGIVALIARHPIAEVTALDHLPTRTALRAELAFLDALDAPADAALGSLAQPSGRMVRLWAAVASPDGRRLVRSDLTAPLDEPELLGSSVARQLRMRGADIALQGVAG
jgi:hydroxymethylbilane synthase